MTVVDLPAVVGWTGTPNPSSSLSSYRRPIPSSLSATSRSSSPESRPPQEKNEQGKHAWSNRGWDRRSVLAATAATTATSLLPSLAASAATSNTAVRSIDIGAGVDISKDTRSMILSDPPNVVFPSFVAGGRWSCERSVVSVEGDYDQAQSAWKALGGSDPIRYFGTKGAPERYVTRFIGVTSLTTKDPKSNNKPKLSNNTYAVLDRRFEAASRLHLVTTTTTTTAASAASIFNDKNYKLLNIEWSPNQPNLLQIGGTELAVMRRSVVIPNVPKNIMAQGEELIRITELPFVSVVLVKQRFRPSTITTTENKITNSSTVTLEAMEGLEVVKTYQVLDGVVETEFPTSTTESIIRLVRLPSRKLSEQEEEETKYIPASSSALYFDGSAWY